MSYDKCGHEQNVRNKIVECFYVTISGQNQNNESQPKESAQLASLENRGDRIIVVHIVLYENSMSPWLLVSCSLSAFLSFLLREGKTQKMRILTRYNVHIDIGA